MKTRSATLAALRVAVLEYVARHPDAADTPEGIAAWWLGSGQPSPSAETLQLVLDQLVAEGLIGFIELVDGTMLYLGRPDQSGH